MPDAVYCKETQLMKREDALKLAEDAVRLQPEHAEIRETRGQILLGLRKWQAAVDDLEWSLAKVTTSSRPAIHAALAEAYGQLGDAARAEQHRALAAPPEAAVPETDKRRLEPSRTPVKQ